jgi:hypothetical protein
MPDVVRCAVLILAVITFYLLPWTPFLIAAFWFTGWQKLALAAFGLAGMMGQPFVLIWWHGPSD